MIRFQMSIETAELIAGLLAVAAERHVDNRKIAQECADKNPGYKVFVDQFDKQVRQARDLSAQFMAADEPKHMFEHLTIEPKEV